MSARHPYASESHPHPAAERVCSGCGCTDDDACINAGGETCGWATPELCTFCAEIIANLPLVELATDAECNALIREMRRP